MKMKCEVIQDLLPLYCDHQASPESCRLIEDHLQECDSCRKVYEEIAEPEITAERTVEEDISEMAKLLPEDASWQSCCNNYRFIPVLLIVHSGTAGFQCGYGCQDKRIQG